MTVEQVEALYRAGLDNGTIVTRNCVSRIAVDREADSLKLSIRSAIGQVNSLTRRPSAWRPTSLHIFDDVTKGG